MKGTDQFCFCEKLQE